MCSTENMVHTSATRDFDWSESNAGNERTPQAHICVLMKMKQPFMPLESRPLKAYAIAGIAKTTLMRLLIGLGGCAAVTAVWPFAHRSHRYSELSCPCPDRP